MKIIERYSVWHNIYVATGGLGLQDKIKVAVINEQ